MMIGICHLWHRGGLEVCGAWLWMTFSIVREMPASSTSQWHLILSALIHWSGLLRSNWAERFQCLLAPDGDSSAVVDIWSSSHSCQQCFCLRVFVLQQQLVSGGVQTKPQSTANNAEQYTLVVCCATWSSNITELQHSFLWSSPSDTKLQLWLTKLDCPLELLSLIIIEITSL